MQLHTHGHGLCLHRLSERETQSQLLLEQQQQQQSFLIQSQAIIVRVVCTMHVFRTLYWAVDTVAFPPKNLNSTVPRRLENTYRRNTQPQSDAITTNKVIGWIMLFQFQSDQISINKSCFRIAPSIPVLCFSLYAHAFARCTFEKDRPSPTVQVAHTHTHARTTRINRTNFFLFYYFS